MKRILFGLGGAAMLALPVAAHAYPAMTMADLNLRPCPSTDCRALTVIPRGAPVEVLGHTGGWDFVTYAGVTGYAAANYLYAGYPAPLPPLVSTYPYPYPLPPYAYAMPKSSWNPLHDAWFEAPAFAMTFGRGLAY